MHHLILRLLHLYIVLVSFSRAQFSLRFANVYDLSVWMPTPTSVRFMVVVPTNNYFAIGFGTSMFGTDMVIWQANGQDSTAVDLYSSGWYSPVIDSQQDYTTTFTYNSTHTTFISDRLLQTGDHSDFVIPTVSLNVLNLCRTPIFRCAIHF